MLRIEMLITLMAMALPMAAGAFPLNEWRLSCGVDRGSITRTGRTWTFRTSSNHCEGGTFNQRAEISTRHVRPDHTGAYLFSTTVSLRAGANEQFTLFQVHDARLGCAPPLSIDVRSDGRLFLKSDVKTGPGESCVRGTLSDRTSQDRLRRDGSRQKLAVLVAFDGTGALDVTLWLDDRPQIFGRYQPQSASTGYRPEKYYFKHGVYSLRQFPYELVSEQMRVQRVRVAR